MKPSRAMISSGDAIRYLYFAASPECRPCPRIGDLPTTVRLCFSSYPQPAVIVQRPLSIGTWPVATAACGHRPAHLDGRREGGLVVHTIAIEQEDLFYRELFVSARKSEDIPEHGKRKGVNDGLTSNCSMNSLIPSLSPVRYFGRGAIVAGGRIIYDVAAVSL